MTRYEFIENKLRKYKEQAEDLGVKLTNKNLVKLKTILDLNYTYKKAKEHAGGKEPELKDLFYGSYCDHIQELATSKNELLNLLPKRMDGNYWPVPIKI